MSDTTRAALNAAHQSSQESSETQQMFADEFIGQVIVIGRLDKLHIDMDHEQGDRTHSDYMDERVKVSCTLTTRDYEGKPCELLYEGQGASMGIALRDCREKIRMGLGA